MNVQKHDTNEEQSFMAMLTQKYKKKFYEEDEIIKFAEEPSTAYSTNSEI
jgi:hypothetical protein